MPREKNLPSLGKSVAGQRAFLWTVVALSCLAVGYVAIEPLLQAKPRKPPKSRFTLSEIPFDGAQAYAYLEQLCDLGPRPSGSPAMTAQQNLIVAHFEQLGAQVEKQQFTGRDSASGELVDMANIIVRWHPKTTDRVLFCAHYDTRPFPDRDKDRPRGRFIGANDGASGTALLMELGRHMASLQGNCGVDFVLFDAEELVYDQDDPYFLGSEHFARDYADDPPAHSYRYGVLLDMVGDLDLELFIEKTGFANRQVRPLIDSLWKVADKLKVEEFVARPKHEVRDDHLPLNDIAKIPTCDVIDFDYEFWHTEQDTPDKCSDLSLAKVGWVVHEWLKAEVKRPRPSRRREPK